MPNGNGGSVVIDASLNSSAMESAINILVADVDYKMNKLAEKFDQSITKMENSMGRMRKTSKDTNVSQNTQEIQSVSHLGESYDKLTSSMQAAAAQASKRWDVSAIQAYRMQLHEIESEMNRLSNVSWNQGMEEWRRVGSQIEATRNQIQQLVQEQERLKSTPVANRFEEQQRLQQYQQLGVQIDALKAKEQELVASHSRLISEFAKETPAGKQLEEVRQKYDAVQQKIREMGNSMQQENAAQVQKTQELERQEQVLQRQVDSSRKLSESVIRSSGTGLYEVGPLRPETPEETQRRLQLEQQEFEAIEAARKAASERAEAEGRLNQTIKERPKQQSNTFSTYEDLRQAIAHVLNVQTSEVQLANEQTASYKKLSATLNQLKTAYSNLTASERNSDNGKALAASIHEVERGIQKIQNQMSRPVSLKEALGNPEKTLDDIIYKMQQLSSYRLGINVEGKGVPKEIQDVNNELERLEKRKKELLNQNQQVINSNNALTRSFNYMKNRLAFYFTVGASTQFVKNLIEIHAQYELLEKSIGILVGSMSEGSHIFAELNAMAIQSPFTTMELGAAAKQLSAYDVAAKDVVNTTKRLADMAAAVGVPIQRLTYALGQVKAYDYLNARDARMFASAGIPLVKELAQYYTELEGRMVSTADVYARMKKHMISYNDTMAVVNKMTDEGGKFFNYQYKMAGTLKVQLANLTLAWNNMLNSIGKDNQSVITFPIKALKTLFKEWNNISSALKTVAIGFGVVKVLQIAYIASATKATTATAIATATNWKFVDSLVAMRAGFFKLISSPITWFTLLAATVVSMLYTFEDANEAIEQFHKSIRDSAKENIENITNFLKDYKKIRESVNGTSDTSDSTQQKPVSNEELTKSWDAIREEIELTSGAGDIFLAQLQAIPDINERVRVSFNYLDSIKAVSAAIEKMSDDTIKIQQDYSKLWNLWLAPDSLYENVRDYTEELHKLELASNAAKRESLDFSERFKIWWEGGLEDAEGETERVNAMLDTVRENILKTSDSIKAFVAQKNWGSSPDYINELYGQIGKKIIQDGLESHDWQPQDVFNFQLEWEEYRSRAAKQATQNRLDEEKEQFKNTEDEKTRIAIKAQIDRDQAQLDTWNQNNGRGRVIWNEFTEWMQNTQSAKVQKMYNEMTENGKKAIDFQSKEWIAFVGDMTQRFTKEHKLSIDDVFNHLGKWVQDANKWKIFIELIVGTGDEDRIYNSLTQADKDADTAYNKVKRLGDEIDRLKEKKKKADAVEGSFIDKNIADTTAAQTKAQEDYNDALERGGKSRSAEADAKKKLTAVNKANAASRREAAKAERQAETELQKSFKDELQILDKAQKAYSDLSKTGMSRKDALAFSTKGYEKSIQHINEVFEKWGIEAFDLSKYAGVSNPREILNMLESQLNTVVAKAKPEEIKELEVKIKDIRLEAEKYDMKKITDGLNNELGKIKEEYELAVELDANPELGDMFADMFGIDVDELPHTFGEAYDKANKVALEKLKKLEKDIQGFDLMSTNLTKFAEKQDIGMDSNLMQELVKDQKTWRDMFKKNLTETEKYLDDYVKKYGNMSDKIAEIEANRLNKIKQLNEAYYTEQMRRMPEYQAKLDAINKGAQREKSSVRFDEFKNSRLYVAMFENLQYVSTATLETIRGKLEQLKSEMGTLTPEQLKQVVQQFEKIDDELRKRSPFEGLIKNYHDYIKANGKAGKQAEKDLVVAQENYDKQMEIVTALKEQLEQEERKEKKDGIKIVALRTEISIENEKLAALDEELQKAIELNEQYNLIKKVFKEQWQSLGKLAQTIATNFKSLGELRDYLKGVGVDFGDVFDGVVDSLQGVSEGINQMVSSASSGDIFGAITGTIKTVFGIGDAIASIFGDGAARTRRINREIEKSQEQVRKLNMAYKDLERTVDKAMGSQETAAQRALIANKKLERAELERQMRLEKSKRSKDRDEDAIKQYEEQIQELTHQIEDLGDSIVENLLGSNIKSAAEDFVDTWVNAWKEGENTLDAVEGKMDEITKNLIKKAIASKIVGTLLQPFYDAVDKAASEQSESGVELSLNELKQLSEMASSIGISINDALLALFTNLENMGIIDKGAGSAELSALQQGITNISETTAEALEAYMNSVSQQVYYQSDILTQIRDILVNFGGDITIATNAQILFELQQSTQIQMSIQSILQGWSNASGLAVRVELAN